MKNDFKAKNYSKVKTSPKRTTSDFFHSGAFSANKTFQSEKTKPLKRNLCGQVSGLPAFFPRLEAQGGVLKRNFRGQVSGLPALFPRLEAQGGPEAEFARADLWAARAFSTVGGAGEF